MDATLNLDAKYFHHEFVKRALVLCIEAGGSSTRATTTAPQHRLTRLFSSLSPPVLYVSSSKEKPYQPRPRFHTPQYTRVESYVGDERVDSD